MELTFQINRREEATLTDSEIELRLSNVDPPAAEPSRTIYLDIDSLPDPVKLSLTARYFNYDNVTLYFQITGSAAGYTFGTVNLGSLGSGLNAYNNLDQFASRAKPSAGSLPSGELQETITLTLSAFTDSGYTTLKWTFSRTVTVYWINSADLAFSVDELDNFDDGTVDGWGLTIEVNFSTGTPATATLAVATDYVLSPPYSLKMAVNETFAQVGEVRLRTYKSFTTANKSKAFAIIDMRLLTSNVLFVTLQNLQIALDGATPTTLIFLGQPLSGSGTTNLPISRWIRIVVPLPVNKTVELRVILDSYYSNAMGSFSQWMDDFKIITK